MDQETPALMRARSLACWSGAVEPEPLSGGITNLNFVVRDGGTPFFVRVGDDIPIHGILRSNELAAAKAAAAAGVSPAVIHAEPGAIVTDFIEGRTFGPEDVRDPAHQAAIVELIRMVHKEMPKHLQGPILIFWAFHVVRSYAVTLREGESRSLMRLPELLAIAEDLEQAVGPIDVVFGHNDLLAANFLDDGKRLWLVDWDYAGFNSPLFDLANVASNNEFSDDQIDALLERYFGQAPDRALKRRFAAMACASLLRETMWSMVSEIHSTLDFDYVAYTEENLARFERTYQDFKEGA
ncbi:MAG: phosphotransferase [Pseudomonadota bacterium]